MNIGQSFQEYFDNHAKAHGLSMSLKQVFLPLLDVAVSIREHMMLAPLSNICGDYGCKNSHGEEVKKLDIIANDLIKTEVLRHKDVWILASEEEKEHVINRPCSRGYILLFDPLDGSSNIDVNVSVGTIFSIYSPLAGVATPSVDHCLQAGHHQVAAGYMLYGSSTLLICSFGHGVLGFSYDPKQGQFILSHEYINTPKTCTYYSVNEGQMTTWNQDTIDYINYLKGIAHKEHSPLISARYVGSLVADFHRNLLKGGIYIYPATHSHPQGKLRLLYEANPLAFICEQAGGKATNGHNAILSLNPTQLHQRVPLYLGSKKEVEMAKRLFTLT